jgi:hypothetical protein
MINRIVNRAFHYLVLFYKLSNIPAGKLFLIKSNLNRHTRF